MTPKLIPIDLMKANRMGSRWDHPDVTYDSTTAYLALIGGRFCAGYFVRHPSYVDFVHGSEHQQFDPPGVNRSKWQGLWEIAVTGAPRQDAEEDRLGLWAHLISEHAGIFGLDLTMAELTEIHEHEHDGPGTIRNHPRVSRVASIAKIGKVCSEIEEGGEAGSHCPSCDGDHL